MREVHHALQWTGSQQGMHACQIYDLDFFRMLQIIQIEALIFHLARRDSLPICHLYALRSQLVNNCICMCSKRFAGAVLVFFSSCLHL